MPEIVQSRKSTSVIQFFVLCCKQNGGILKYQSEKSCRFSNFTCMLVVTLNRKISVLVIKLYSRRWCLIHFTLWLRSCNAIFVFASFFYFLINIIMIRSINGHAWLIVHCLTSRWRVFHSHGDAILLSVKGCRSLSRQAFVVSHLIWHGVSFISVSAPGGRGVGGGLDSHFNVTKVDLNNFVNFYYTLKG